MKELFEVFRMDSLSIEARIRVMKKLGVALDNQYGMNWTEEIIAELTSILLSSQKPIGTVSPGLCR